MSIHINLINDKFGRKFPKSRIILFFSAPTKNTSAVAGPRWISWRRRKRMYFCFCFERSIAHLKERRMTWSLRLLYVSSCAPTKNTSAVAGPRWISWRRRKRMYFCFVTIIADLKKSGMTPSRRFSYVYFCYPTAFKSMGGYRVKDSIIQCKFRFSYARALRPALWRQKRHRFEILISHNDHN